MPQRLVSNRSLLIYVALEPKIAFISKATKRLKGCILEIFSGRHTKCGSGFYQLVPYAQHMLIWFYIL